MLDNQVLSRIEKALPFRAFQFVDVEFTAPNEYIRVPHALNPDNPYDVRYIVVAKDKDSTISDNRNDPESTMEWTTRWIVLKSNQAPSTAELLLVIRK